MGPGQGDLANFGKPKPTFYERRVTEKVGATKTGFHSLMKSEIPAAGVSKYQIRSRGFNHPDMKEGKRIVKAMPNQKSFISPVSLHMRDVNSSLDRVWVTKP